MLTSTSLVPTLDGFSQFSVYSVHQINLVFGGSWMMLGANNSQSVKCAVADVSQVSQCLTIYLQCVFLYICPQFSLSGGEESVLRYLSTSFVPFPYGRREELHHVPDHAVPQARPARLQCSCRQQVHGEREELR